MAFDNFYMWAKLNRLRGLIRVISPFSLSVFGRFLCCVWMTTNCSSGAFCGLCPCACAVGVQYKVLPSCCTAGGRLLSFPVLGSGLLSCSGGSCGSLVRVAVAWVCCDEHATGIAFALRR